MSIVAKVEIPEDVFLSLRESTEEIALNMKRSLAVNYYKDKKLSLGQCTELAEMSKVDFIKYLSKHHISIFNFDSKEELLEDIRNA